MASGPPGENAAEAPRARPFDWPSLVAMARQEGISAVLFYQIKKHRLEALLPPDVLRGLSGPYYANLKRNLTIAAALRPVLDALEEADIPCIVLKGIALAEQAYPDIAMRGMSDVDILVRKGDLLRADARLSTLGYDSRDSDAATAFRNPAGYLASLEYGKGGESPLTLHLHWHPVNTSVPATAFIDGIDIEALWEKAVPARVADGRARMLCPEHLILYLCEHALRVGHSFDRLILVCDIHFAIRRFENEIDWDCLAAEGLRLGLSRFAYHGLTIAKRYTGLPIPETCLAQLKPPDLSRGERLFLHLQLRNRRVRGSSYLVYLALNRGLFEKARFIFRTFFPPREILLQRRRGKGRDFTGTYYLSRIKEVFSHFFRSIHR